MKELPYKPYLDKITENNGFIAALDQSGGSTPKALALYGIEESDYSNEEEMFEISYRKKKYYRDKENKVYEIKDNDEVGSCIGNWVKQDNGKFKVVKK